MASNINPNNINGAYPIAGQDNDSQGFRDNFTNTRTNLTFAQTEITDLQLNAVLKAPLSGGTINNEFNWSVMQHAITKGFVETYKDNTTQLGAIDFSNGDIQSFIAPAAATTAITFTTWPATAGIYAKIRVLISVPNVSCLLSIPTTYIGASKIAGYVSGTITPPSTGHYLLEFSTIDNGSTIMVVPLITP